MYIQLSFFTVALACIARLTRPALGLLTPAPSPPQTERAALGSGDQ